MMIDKDRVLELLELLTTGTEPVRATSWEVCGCLSDEELASILEWVRHAAGDSDSDN